MDTPAKNDPQLLEIAANIASAYVSRNAIPTNELPTFIRSIYENVSKIAHGTPERAPVAPPTPAVSIKKSVSEDFIICLEDGKKFKSLKRHLDRKYGMTPDDYRRKWGLPHDYPMVAPAYAVKRSELAKQSGLGSKQAGIPKKTTEAAKKAA